MSASNSRVRDSIRRIALSDPDIRALLDDFKNRGGTASDSVDIEGAADGRSICCDGSTSSGTPGSSTREPDTAGAGQDASGGLDPDNPADLDMGAGSLTGVKDCTTGEPVCFAGSDWVPPEGWDSPAGPPYVASYAPGTFWVATNNPGGERSYTAEGACGSFYVNGFTDGGDTAGCTPSPDGGLTAFTVERRECAASAEDDICRGVNPPRETAWPADGCINLAAKGGKLVASKYDPEAAGSSYLKGVEEIELCDDFGNSFTTRASGSSLGGWKTIDSSNPGDGYLYNAQGEQIARISGSEYSDPSV